jgi:hypothetical protein
MSQGYFQMQLEIVFVTVWFTTDTKPALLVDATAVRTKRAASALARFVLA